MTVPSALLMACADESVMTQEQQYLAALQSAGSFTVTAESLIIQFDNEQGVLNFVPASAPAESPETPPADASTPTPAEEVAVASPIQSAKWVWLCDYCMGQQAWVFENGQASQVALPVELGIFYGYAPATDRILYASHFPSVGAGPAQISVSDLWQLTVATGQTEPIFSADEVVEADWAADGQAIVYVRATAETYELRWRTADGSDKLLASDVAFTFSAAPDGKLVAFTRESAYKVGGEPGLYVVDVNTGAEQKLSEVDRAGTGGIEDRPMWSSDSHHVALSTGSMVATPTLIVAAVDGSATRELVFDPALSGEPWYNVVPTNPVWLDATHLLGTAMLVTESAPMGGQPHVILYSLDENLTTIVDGVSLAEGALAELDPANNLAWVQLETEMQAVPLPVLE